MEINRMNDFNIFQQESKKLGIEIKNNQLDLFKTYYKVLLEWNEKINLISRKEENILERHFLDSILFLPEIEKLCRCWSRPAPTATVLDIGSGGGFPAIPLAIMKPKWGFTLCESIKKKANFLTHLVKELGLKNITVINDRVENIASKGRFQTCLYKNKFDFVTVRAVAKLDVLIKYALPLLQKDGYLLAYKAKDIDEEIKNITLPLQIFSKELNGVERKLVVIQPWYSSIS